MSARRHVGVGFRSRWSLCWRRLCMPTSIACAHEIRPAYLQIDEVGPGRYQLLWRTPVLSGMRLPVMLRLPDEIHRSQRPRCRNSPIRWSNIASSTPGLADWLGSVLSSSGFRQRSRTCWCACRCSMALIQPRWCTRRIPGSTSRRRKDHWRSRAPICRMASSTFCSASTIFYSCSGLFSS